jgi:hypothetical protein
MVKFAGLLAATGGIALLLLVPPNCDDKPVAGKAFKYDCRAGIVSGEVDAIEPEPPPEYSFYDFVQGAAIGCVIAGFFPKLRKEAGGEE